MQAHVKFKKFPSSMQILSCVCVPKEKERKKGKKERIREKGEQVMVSLKWQKEAFTVFVLLNFLFNLHFLTL